MPDNVNEHKLKLIHLVYGLFIAALGIGIAIGDVMRQQKTNTKDVETKVSKEIFNQHKETQQQQFKSMNTNMSEGFRRIETKLDKK